jgi:Domain of unknown function (DUF5615)
LNSIKLYLDEDAMDDDLVGPLRSRGVNVTTTLDVGQIGKTDEEQLAFATGRDCVLYSFNISDFCRLHTQ